MAERRFSWALHQAGYEVLNLGLHAAHLSLIVFTIVGWVFCETRILHLIMMGMVAFSWLGLGFYFGFGYCLLTDIQWKLRVRMGGDEPTAGYMKMLADRLTGRDLNADRIDTITYSVCASCAAASLGLTMAVGTC